MSTNQNETDLLGVWVAVVVAYWVFVAWAVLAVVFPNVGGLWLLVPWIVIAACAVVGGWQYRRFRRQRRLRQAVLQEAIQVVEDADRRYGGM